jgi:hypothetical protein
LGTAYGEIRADLGVVLLAENADGVVSPSKFSGYIEFGLPILYIGPPNTNAYACAALYGAGFCIRDGAQDEEIAALARLIASPQARAAATIAVPSARSYFDQFDGESFLRQLSSLVIPISSASII